AAAGIGCAHRHNHRGRIFVYEKEEEVIAVKLFFSVLKLSEIDNIVIPEYLSLFEFLPKLIMLP
ncbi:MAG TPA: hypothetical protein PKK68_11565, partial [Methanothrix soehngenii]|nr:hypothetical protein [Methanothrix soehngenii]